MRHLLNITVTVGGYVVAIGGAIVLVGLPHEWFDRWCKWWFCELTWKELDD